MYIVNLFEKIGKSSIWGHETGKKFRELILEEWKKRDDELLIIDLKGIEIIDFSASSDLICIPISRLSSELLNKHKSVDVNFSEKSFEILQTIMLDYGAIEKKVPYDKLIYNEK